ncbi:MAG: lipid-A-disaccharide synthase, partial [Microcystaceae cyanobacterium]
VGKRLGYRTVIYAEWEARWYRWIDAFGVMNEKVLANIPAQYHHKMRVTGDLMADGHRPDWVENETEIVGILPGSKPGKLTQGVPLCLAIATEIHRQRPQTRFELAVAPTLTPETLAQYADTDQNPMVNLMGGITAQLSPQGEELALVTPQGLTIYLITDFPARDRLSQFRLALTTVGANTAELGSLAVPMVILLPTQHLEAMRNWDGLPGLLARLPGVGRYLARLINYWILSQKRLFAWPNLWAGREIVPELVGTLEPQPVANQVVDLLAHPDQLAQMRQALQQVRGQPGAARAIAELVAQQLPNF